MLPGGPTFWSQLAPDSASFRGTDGLSKLLFVQAWTNQGSPGGRDDCKAPLICLDHEGQVIVRKVQGKPPRVALVATDGTTPPIWFGQGADPEILGVVTVGVHHLVD